MSSLDHYGYPSCVKIGKTKREPSKFAARLTRITSSPHPFVTEWSMFIERDIHAVNRFVYTQLKEFQINEGGSFFNMPVPLAIEKVGNIISAFFD